MINRQRQAREHYNMNFYEEDDDTSLGPQENRIDFSKIRVGLKTLDDAIVNLNDFKKINPKLGDKDEVLRAIDKCDYGTMRDISDFFYRTSGIYSRLCRYMAYLYRYDWILTPYINTHNPKTEKILSDFHKALMFLDDFESKRFFGEVALKVIRNGCYYGYKIEQDNTVAVQELPPKYCRTRYNVRNNPAVEFNMKFFDEVYTDSSQRMKILNLFPKEFKTGYIKYKEGKLPKDFMGDENGWYLLDVENTIKFNINGEDFPAFISVIPSIIDLSEAQGLDRKKMQQQILKVIIQKVPLDKNGELLFDGDEIKDLHRNAVAMIGNAIGLNVLTTFADVDVADMADKKTTTTTDELAKVERGIYNEAGVSQMQFNTDGNLALEKSILNDEASMNNLLLQFERFLNDLIKPFNKIPKKVLYKVQMLPTTIYNYKEVSKIFKEQTQLGYSKMLPQIALGQSQASILANAYFENDILDLVNVFIPPMSSSTMNAEVLNKTNNENEDGEEKKAGRKEKPDDEKSEKTIKNIEAGREEDNG